MNDLRKFILIFFSYLHNTTLAAIYGFSHITPLYISLKCGLFFVFSMILLYLCYKLSLNIHLKIPFLSIHCPFGFYLLSLSDEIFFFDGKWCKVLQGFLYLCYKLFLNIHLYVVFISICFIFSFNLWTLSNKIFFFFEKFCKVFYGFFVSLLWIPWESWS